MKFSNSVAVIGVELFFNKYRNFAAGYQVYCDESFYYNKNMKDFNFNILFLNRVC